MMPNLLTRQVLQHLGDFPKKLPRHCHSLYEYAPMPPVMYPELKDEMWCIAIIFGIYVMRFDFLISLLLSMLNFCSRCWSCGLKSYHVGPWIFLKKRFVKYWRFP